MCRSVRGLGYVEPVSEIRRLVFRIDGVIQTCPVQLGRRVAKDELLATLANGDVQAAVSEAEAQLALAIAEREQLLAGIRPHQIVAAQRNVELREEQLRFARLHRDRIDRLAATKATATQELDRAESESRQAMMALSQAQADLANLEHHVRAVDIQVADADVRLAEARVATSRQSLADTVLKAPFSGTILEIFKREGEGARLTDREPVLLFADDSQLRVRAEIDERWAHQLKAGQRAEIYGRGLGRMRQNGTISLVKRTMGNKTVFSHEASERKDLDVLQVLIDLPPEFKAPLGLQVDVDIHIVEANRGVVNELAEQLEPIENVDVR